MKFKIGDKVIPKSSFLNSFNLGVVSGEKNPNKEKWLIRDPYKVVQRVITVEPFAPSGWLYLGDGWGYWDPENFILLGKKKPLTFKEFSNA